MMIELTWVICPSGDPFSWTEDGTSWLAPGLGHVPAPESGMAESSHNTNSKDWELGYNGSPPICKCYTSVSLLLSRTQGYCYHLSKFHIYALVYIWNCLQTIIFSPLNHPYKYHCYKSPMVYFLGSCYCLRRDGYFFLFSQLLSWADVQYKPVSLMDNFSLNDVVIILQQCLLGGPCILLSSSLHDPRSWSCYDGHCKASLTYSFNQRL